MDHELNQGIFPGECGISTHGVEDPDESAEVRGAFTYGDNGTTIHEHLRLTQNDTPVSLGHTIYDSGILYNNHGTRPTNYLQMMHDNNGFASDSSNCASPINFAATPPHSLTASPTIVGMEHQTMYQQAICTTGTPQSPTYHHGPQQTYYWTRQDSVHSGAQSVVSSPIPYNHQGSSGKSSSHRHHPHGHVVSIPTQNTNPRRIKQKKSEVKYRCNLRSEYDSLEEAVRNTSSRTDPERIPAHLPRSELLHTATSLLNTSNSEIIDLQKAVQERENEIFELKRRLHEREQNRNAPA